MNITAETPLERSIIEDAEWIEGALWGKPRRGHPEGKVHLHIEEVLNNIDEMNLEGLSREDLRIIALIHDTFKHRVDTKISRDGENHHAMIARRFAERFIPDREDLLDIIELHDEAYNAYMKGARKDDLSQGIPRAQKLLDRLGENLDLYLAFYEADNNTGDKTQENLEWFIDFCNKQVI